MSNITNKSISEIILDNYHAIDVFKKYGINYSTKAETALSIACIELGLDINSVIDDIKNSSFQITISNKLHLQAWKLTFLIDYIKHIHHDYVAIIMPQLEKSAASFYELNKNKYPFFEKILSCIHNINLLMVINNRHEDEILFPYILQIEKLYEKEEEYGQLFVRTLRKPLNILEKGNLAINELINEVETLTDNYTCSKKASLAMKVLYKQMKEMQDIFTQQKYLENAILFPKAMEIENIVLKEKYNN